MNRNSTLTGRCILMLTLFISLATTSNSQIYPNMKFVSPILTSGIAGHENAVYKFTNVITNVNALVTIEKITNGAILVTIDDTTMGYYNAWQPIG